LTATLKEGRPLAERIRAQVAEDERWREELRRRAREEP